MSMQRPSQKPPSMHEVRAVLHVLGRELHDVWCVVSGRCRLLLDREDLERDPRIAELREKEREAREATAALRDEATERRRRQNFLEVELMRRRKGRGHGGHTGHASD